MADIPGTPVDGNTRVMWVPTIANTAAPTAAEISAGVDVSCYLTADGWNTSLSETTTSDKRLCQSQDFEGKGRFSRSLDIKYIENPAGTVNNLAYTTLVPGTTGNFVVRRGLPYATAIIATHKVNVWPVTMGEYDPQPPEENSVFKVAQKTFVTGKVTLQVAVV